MAAEPSYLAPPGEVHPYYADNKFVIEWVLGHSPNLSRAAILIATGWGLRDIFTTSPYPTERDVPRVLTMRRMQAWGPAPYVGDPFAYVWDIGVDDLGRQVAGLTQIKRQPVPKPVEKKPWDLSS